MPFYKVRYSGFVYIEADCPEDAADEYCDNEIYKEEEIDSIEEIDEDDMVIDLC